MTQDSNRVPGGRSTDHIAAKCDRI